MPAKSPSPPKGTKKALQKLGQQLRDRRKTLGVSMISAAEAARMSRVTLHRIERGEPSVTIGAYFNLIESLGLGFRLTDQIFKAKSSLKKIPKEIRLADYKQLKRIAWQLKGTQKVTPKEALELYERNWRHVDVKKMDAQEKEFLKSLLEAFGRERLLV